MTKTEIIRKKHCVMLSNGVCCVSCWETPSLSCYPYYKGFKIPERR